MIGKLILIIIGQDNKFYIKKFAISTLSVLDNNNFKRKMPLLTKGKIIVVKLANDQQCTSTPLVYKNSKQ